MITVYRSDDAGAPVLDNTAGSLIALLTAVLIDGYGAKTPLNWTKPYVNGTNIAAFRMPEGSRSYLRVEDGILSAQVRGYQQMDDIDASGLEVYESNPFPNLSTNTYLWKTNDALSSWIIIGGTTGFYMYTGVSNVDLDPSTFNPEFANLFYFGDQKVRNQDDDTYCGIIIGATSDTPTSNSVRFGLVSEFGYSGFSGHYVSRNYETSQSSGYSGNSGIGASFSKGRNYRLVNNLGDTMGADVPDAYPNPLTGKADVCEITIAESNTIYRGILPGLYEIISGINGPDFFTEFVCTDNLAGKTLLLFPSCNQGILGKIGIQITPDWYA